MAITWWRMTGNLVLRVVFLYGVPAQALRQAAGDITAALADGALAELPVHRYRLDDIAAAHEAVEDRAGQGSPRRVTGQLITPVLPSTVIC